jgi:hypothetical protein
MPQTALNFCFYSGCAQNKIKEKSLFCEPLKEMRKAVDTTAMAKEFFNSKSIYLSVICTDGAVAILVKDSGFKISVKNRM